MIPYAPRPIAFLGLRELSGFRTKLYSVLYGAGPFELARFAPGLALAAAALPTPAHAPGRPAVAFAIAHQGNGGDYVVLCWWDRENELPTRVFVRPSDEPAWRPANPRESFCVWDLELLWFEREAYVATLLAGGTEADYLARTR